MKFKRVRNWKQHLESVHGEINPFECSSCYLKFKKKSELKRHMSEAHGETITERKINERIKQLTEVKSEIKSIEVQCTKCNIMFGSSGTLKRHLSMVHEKNKKFQCSFCEEQFASRKGMKKHIAFDHDGRCDDSCVNY